MSAKPTPKPPSSPKKRNSGSGSATNSSAKPPVKYTSLPRTWPANSSSHTGTPSESTANTQQDATPIQRWENESLNQSYWTGVAAYEDTSAPDTSNQGGAEQNTGGAENWSMTGDPESERFY